MSAAVTAPDPAESSRAGLLIHLLHRLIDCGNQLISALRQYGTAVIRAHACHFGTEDLPLILARITRGLQLAAALQARIMSSAASLDAAPKPACPASSRIPRKPRPTPPQAAAVDPRLAALPTTAELADAIRHRPIGSVLADICRDLGILPCHALWRELKAAIIRYRGNLTRLLVDIMNQPFPPFDYPAAAAATPPPTAPPGATGPPVSATG